MYKTHHCDSLFDFPLVDVREVRHFHFEQLDHRELFRVIGASSVQLSPVGDGVCRRCVRRFVIERVIGCVIRCVTSSGREQRPAMG